MKRFLTIILTTIVSLSAFGQYKVVESSTKRAPNWLNSVQDQHLIVSATGNSIEQAKEAVLSNIKKQITQSIASRIVSETNLFTSSLQSDGSYSKTQAVESAVMSRTAKLPFIGEISLSKAIEYYWEKRYYKKEGTYEYFYAVIYPFSDFEMKKLIMDYEEHDKRLNQQLAEYEIAIENIISTEDIEANITKLTAFKEEFDYTDPRFKQTEGLITRFKQQYNNIDIDAFQEKKGLIFLTLSLGDREISTSQRPTITSNCATEISYSYEGNTLVIRYNSDNCYDDDENYVLPRELVVGDIVVLEAGDSVPADLRLTECASLQIQEAALTGESQPVAKSVEPLEGDCTLGDRVNMAFSSCSVTAGRGRGVVVAIGSDTEVGHIASMISSSSFCTTQTRRRIPT